MADEKKISGLTEASDASASDEFVMVNKDVTSGADASATGQTSKITLDNLRNAILGGSSGSTGNNNVEFSHDSGASAVFTFPGIGNDNVGSKFRLIDSTGETAVSLTSNSSYIFNGGNVGIGTDSPDAPLTIKQVVNNASLNLSATTSNDQETAGSQGLYQDIELNGHPDSVSSHIGQARIRHHFNPWHDSNSALSFWTTNHSDQSLTKERMRICSDGNVGIGTASPSELLVVGDDIGNLTTGKALVIGNTSPSTEPAALRNARLFMGKDTDNFGVMSWFPEGGYMSIMVKADGTINDNQLVLGANGNVGIGTDDPNEKFHVVGRSQLENSAANHSSVVIVQSRPNDNSGQPNARATNGHQGALALLSHYSHDASGEGQGMTEGNWTGIDFNGAWSRKKKDEAGEFIEPVEIESSGFGMGQLLCEAPSINTKNDGTSSLKSDMVLITRSHSGGLQERMRIGEHGMDLASAVIKDKGNVFIKSDSSGTHIGPAVYDEGGTGVVSFHNKSVVAHTDETVRIDTNGNVGIGSNLSEMHSNYGLSIHNRGGILVRNTQGALQSQTGIIRSSISDRYDQYDWGVGINQVCENVSNGFGMAFWTRDAYNGTYTEKVRISRHGHVGIGTPAPRGPLEVRNPTNHCVTYITSGSTAHYSELAFCHDEGNEGDIRNRASIRGKYASDGGGQMDFYTDTTGGTKTLRMTIQNNGHVNIIGTLSSNSVHLTGLDADDLDNIRASEANALEKLNELVVSDFEKDGVTKVGIVAQDMQKVLPQSVSGGVEHEVVGAEVDAPERQYAPLTTSNDELVATLVKAVQELSAKNDELSAKNDELSAKVDELSK